MRTWHVEVTVEGLNMERFIRRAGEKEISLANLRRISPRRISAQVQESMLPLLNDVVEQGGWTLKTGKRKGTGRAVVFLHRRWLLTGMMVLFACAIYGASLVMWRVEIVDGGAYAADICQAVTEWGIIAPRLRRQVNLGTLKDELEWRYPQIAWFECGWRGTTLVIRPVEGVLPQVESEDGSCDVVAVRDGIVQGIVTRAGTPQVKAGDFVHRGDVLIKGVERTGDGGLRAVAARGTVTARVWTGASVKVSAVERSTSYTGNEQTVWTIRTPWFDLWKMDACPYSQFDTQVTQQAVGGIFLPVTLHTERRMEAQIDSRMRDMKELEADAYAAALRKLHEKVGAEESLIDIWGNCSMIDAENIVSVAIGEMLVEIGRQVPASGMAAPDVRQSQ